MRLTGYDGITNYVHMTGAGHLRYFLRKWRNLNRLSNQGWESYNALVTAYSHHRTMKGGGKGEDRSKILAIAHWLSRMIMWRSGEGDRYFTSLKNIDNLVEEQNDDSSDDESVAL